MGRGPRTSLIFERIREELRAVEGRRSSAVDQGFKRAFPDDHRQRNVTNDCFLRCVSFFIFGDWPRTRLRSKPGSLGCSPTCFTSVYVSRVIFDWHLAEMPRGGRAEYLAFYFGNKSSQVGVKTLTGQSDYGIL